MVILYQSAGKNMPYVLRCLFLCVGSVGSDKAQQVLHGLVFRQIFLYTLLATLERYVAGAGPYVAIVGVCHLTGAVHYAAHDAYLEPFQVGRSRTNFLDGIA